MSKAQWPKIRARSYRWQDKSGAVRKGANFQINCTLLNGTRYQRSFKDRKDAEADAARLRDERAVELKNRTVSLNHLSDAERIDVLEARRILDGKANLLQSAAFYIEHNILPTGPVLTVNEAIKRYMQQSKEDGLRDRSIQDLCGRLQKFADTFGKKAVTSISRSDADEWLRGLKKRRHKPYSPLSRQHFKVIVSGLFNWMIEKEYAKVNPFAPLSTSRRGKKLLRDSVLPGILTPDQVKKLLITAQTEIPGMLAPLALSFFAGLRTSELRQLRWEDINFENGLITVRPEVAKRRRARHVEMEPNLIQWLLTCRHESGIIVPGGQGYRIQLDRVRLKAGFERKHFSDYPKNAGRHTYATMALQKYQSANKVALMLGHTTTGLLFDHYKALATPQQAEQYWNIKPSQKDNVISFPATA
ncbi:MAG: tyrosine-type recombinase/integrase [Verrucomicrobiota bacterium]